MMKPGDRSPNKGKARLVMASRVEHRQRRKPKVPTWEELKADWDRGWDYFWSKRGGPPAYGLLDRQQQEIEEAKQRKAKREGVA